MYSHLNKNEENQHKSISSDPVQKQSKNDYTDFVDNSPEAKQAAQLQAMADNSPETKQAAQLQAMADNSPEAKEAAQLQAMADKNSEAEQPIAPNKPNNTGLPDDLKTGIENLSGYSMDDVKVHYNSDKPAQLQAHAYAQGTDIYLASGQEKHLPHEAWHVVQQMQGRVKPTVATENGVGINDDKGLEREADVMGRKIFEKKEIMLPDTFENKNYKSIYKNQNKDSKGKKYQRKAIQLKALTFKEFEENYLNSLTESGKGRYKILKQLEEKGETYILKGDDGIQKNNIDPYIFIRVLNKKEYEFKDRHEFINIFASIKYATTKFGEKYLGLENNKEEPKNIGKNTSKDVKKKHHIEYENNLFMNKIGIKEPHPVENGPKIQSQIENFYNEKHSKIETMYNHYDKYLDEIKSQDLFGKMPPQKIKYKQKKENKKLKKELNKIFQDLLINTEKKSMKKKNIEDIIKNDNLIDMGIELYSQTLEASDYFHYNQLVIADMCVNESLKNQDSETKKSSPPYPFKPNVPYDIDKKDNEIDEQIKALAKEGKIQFRNQGDLVKHFLKHYEGMMDDKNLFEMILDYIDEIRKCIISTPPNKLDKKDKEIKVEYSNKKYKVNVSYYKLDSNNAKITVKTAHKKHKTEVALV